MTLLQLDKHVTKRVRFQVYLKIVEVIKEKNKKLCKFAIVVLLHFHFIALP